MVGLKICFVSDAKTIKELRRLRINIKDFEVKNVIGRGHFGEVQVVREKNSGDVYALKVLRKADTLAQQNVSGQSMYMVYIILTSLFSTCRPYRDRQKPTNVTQCPTLMTDS